MFKGQLAKDLDVFLNPNEFGTAALYNGKSIVVDFRSHSDVVFDGRGDNIHDVSGSVPSCTCKVSDIDGIETGDPITVDEIAYYVLDLDDPSGGMQKIYLSKDRP